MHCQWLEESIFCTYRKDSKDGLSLKMACLKR
jgi:hypothetical protein